MEFLMTYGWAILVLIIVMAVLFYIGVLNPKSAQSETLFFTPGFSAYSFRVGNGTGSLDLDFGQATGKSIRVTGVSCSTNESANISALDSNITVPSGEHRWITGGDSENSGISCEGATGEAGERYKGKVCVNYTESGTNTQRIVCGEINARLEPAPTPTPAPSPGWLYGAVTNCSNPLGGATVTTGSRSNTSNASGQYIIYDVAPGTRSVTATKSGHFSRTMTANVTSGSGTQLDFTVPQQVNISSCQTLDQCRYYLLTTNLNPSDTCMSITSGAAGATLDCAHHLINGSGSGAGIYLNWVGGVAVKDCNVSHFSSGIQLYFSNSNNITGNTATSNTYGIYMGNDWNTHHNLITGNSLSSNTYGVYMYGSRDNTINYNNATSNGNGILLFYNGIYNTFTGNNASNNTNYGISISGSAGATLTNNYACTNANDANNYDISCDIPETDGGGNTCRPEGGNACSTSINCSSGCPVLLPPTCASDWIVKECPCELNVPGNYSLGTDLNATSTCITFLYTAGSSTLNCYNHLINGSGSGAGIYLNWVGGVAVKDCNVSHFSSGIQLYFSNSNNITGNTATSNTYGIYMGNDWNTHHNLITGNSLSSNTYGVYMYGSRDNTLTGNNATSNAYGILLFYNGIYNTFTGNNASNNTNYGISISDSAGATLTNNYVCANANDADNYDISCNIPETDGGGNTCMPEGMNACSSSINCSPGCPAHVPQEITDCGVISVAGDYYLNRNLTASGTCITFGPSTSGSTLECNNHFINGSGSGAGIYLNWVGGVAVKDCNVSHFSSGIQLYFSNSNNITGNTATSNTYGIYMGNDWNTHHNLITGNSLSSNTYGVYMYGSRDNTLTGNNATSNAYGILLFYNGIYNTFTGNNASNNTNYGISISDSGGNTLSDNTACNPSATYDIYCNSAEPGDGGNTCNGTLLSCSGVTCDYSCP